MDVSTARVYMRTMMVHTPCQYLEWEERLHDNCDDVINLRDTNIHSQYRLHGGNSKLGWLHIIRGLVALELPGHSLKFKFSVEDIRDCVH